MNIPSFDQLSKITDSRYSAVMLIAQRARQLLDGDDQLVDLDSNKPVSIAMEEAVQGKITYGSKEEAQRQEWIKSERRRLERLASRDREEEE
ncbi:MAG: DNA-directed RNA polymerase subunit omega [Tissierellia bacterium]|nr:DNA-directed RNA polymerase subunit omega [Tissierellia bacterium]